MFCNTGAARAAAGQIGGMWCEHWVASTVQPPPSADANAACLGLPSMLWQLAAAVRLFTPSMPPFPCYCAVQL
jgi:hypothetical protein